MPYYCTVPRCTSMAGKAKNVSFHQFPRDEELAKLWNKILKRGKPYTKYSKVCSLHFTADDYTITSVGKNKGQWRTLRKDAIPSQNLPSESPTPYQRKQWSSWAHSPTTNVMDPTIQQQVAQAIYMQTMLAMQAAGPTELPALNHANGLPLPLPTESFAHTSTAPDTDILKGKQTNTEQNTSYKCTECSKCFKDPDVFILHKRTHIKNEKNEKENFNLNVTLQANPILANLLKTNPENSNIFDNNLMSVESLLMTALAANMEGYMRNFTSIMKGEHRSLVDHDRHELDHDRDMMDHSRDMMDHGRDMMDQDRGIMGRGRDEVDHDRGMMNNDDNESDDTEDLNHDQNILNHVTTHLDRRGNYNQNNLDLKPAFNEDCQSMMQKRALDHARGIPNDDRSYMSHDSGLMSHDIDLINQNRGSNLADRDNTVFQNSILENFRNKASNISFKNVNLNGSTRNEIEIGNFYRGVIDCDRTVTDHERVMTDDDNDDGITNDDDSQGSNAGPVCDSDLNESIDSNKLVIDENV